MQLDYAEFEKELDSACNFTFKKFLSEFNNDSTYVSAGGAKLEVFIDSLQKEFDKATIAFLAKYKAEYDPEAKRKLLTIAKARAKKCIEEFSKVDSFKKK